MPIPEHGPHRCRTRAVFGFVWRASQTHEIQGIGAGFIPKVPTLDPDRMIAVSDDSKTHAELIGRREGLHVGTSAGANVFAALQVAEALGEGKTVVTVLCDTGDRYTNTSE